MSGNGVSRHPNARDMSKKLAWCRVGVLCRPPVAIRHHRCAVNAWKSTGEVGCFSADLLLIEEHLSARQDQPWRATPILRKEDIWGGTPEWLVAGWRPLVARPPSLEAPTSAEFTGTSRMTQPLAQIQRSRSQADI